MSETATDFDMNEVAYYCIYDHKAGFYDKPWTAPNNAVAIRSFEALVNDQASLVSKYPEDYSLWRTGRFNQLDGMTSGEAPVCLIKAVELKNGSNNQLEGPPVLT